MLAGVLLFLTIACGQGIGGVELSADSVTYEARRLMEASKHMVLGFFQKGNGMISGAQEKAMQTVLKPAGKANTAVSDFNASAQERHDQATQIDN